MSEVWSRQDWSALERDAASGVVSAPTPEMAWRRMVRASRSVLRAYSTSFFIVTRFLPPAKRGQVEIVYAAVRFPDEIVDTFPLSSADRLQLLNGWASDYERGLEFASLRDAVDAGLDCFVAAFAQVVRERGIPHEHYRSFLDAMRLDVTPRPYLDLEDLVESYVYGSATVVGYFLAYIYGAASPDAFERALEGSRDLGIALQLTNFLRDVPEDKRRGRVYLPVDMLRAEGLADVDLGGDHLAGEQKDLRALKRVLRRVSEIAEQHYSRAEANLDAFSPDCRVAIQSCIDVYRQLNLRIGSSSEGVLHRESVPLNEKFRVLPSSKYWRLPLAYLGAI